MASNPSHLAEADSATHIPGIDELVVQYYDTLTHLATSVLGDAAEAQDAAQETLIVAANALHRYRGESSLKTWLFAIALNVCRKHLRRRRTRTLLRGMLEKLHLTSPHAPDAEQALDQSLASQALWAAVNALSDTYRLPILLRYLHGLPVREIAHMLNTSESAIHVRLHHARRTLHERLRSDYLPDAEVRS
jgi:RNA polymerase sigma-70 factor (ECF subfamily)